MGVQFLIHLLLSLGHFQTEIDLTSHSTIRECMQYAKLIGESIEPVDLERYSNELLLRYFEEQVVTFPNSKQVIQSWVVAAGDLLDSVIIHDEITISDLPAVQYSVLFTKIDEESMEHQKTTKINIIEAAIKELGDTTIHLCNIPSKEELMNTKRDFHYIGILLQIFNAMKISLKHHIMSKRLP